MRISVACRPFASLACLAIALQAAASISDTVIRIDATSSLGAASYSVPFDPACFERDTGTYRWNSTAADLALRDDQGRTIATIRQIGTTLIEDPVVNLSFLVEAGPTDTTFTISSALLSFPIIANAVLIASAQVGATDLDGDGVTVTPGFAGNTKCFVAQYNGFVPTGTTFAALVAGQSGAAFSSNIESEDSGGFHPVAGPMSDMSTSFSFTLSARDSASGTSIYATPEPATLALLTLAALAALRRR